MRALRYLCLLTLVVSLGACGNHTNRDNGAVGTTGTGTPAMTGESTVVNDQDRTLVEKATLDGMAEVKLGEIAKDKSTNEHVKAFGIRMANEHRKASDDLQAVVQRVGMAMPLKLDNEHNDLIDRLSKLNGAEFDREYMKTMVDDHTKAMELFEREARHGQNPHVKEWAEKTLPTLRTHLDMAKDVRARVDRTATY